MSVLDTHESRNAIRRHVRFEQVIARRYDLPSLFHSLSIQAASRQREGGTVYGMAAPVTREQ